MIETNLKKLPEQSSERSGRKRTVIITVLIVTSLALIIRLAYIPSTGIENPGMRGYAVEYFLYGDSVQYYFYGYNIANNLTFSKKWPPVNPEPDDFRAPGYPLLIAAALVLAHINWFSFLMYGQVVIGTLLVPLVFFTARRFMPLWAAAAASLLTGLSPHLVTIGGSVLTELFMAFVCLAALAAFYAAMRSRNVWFYALSGSLFGYGYLINPIILFLPWLLAALALVGEKVSGRSMLRSPLIVQLGVFLLLFLMFYGGWAVRNAVNVRAEGGPNRALLNMVIGSHPDFAKDWREEITGVRHAGSLEPSNDAAYREFRESENSYVRFAGIFFSRFQEKPVRYLGWYIFEKPYILWQWNIVIGWGDVYVQKPERPFYKTSELADFTRKGMRVIHPVTLLMVIAGFWPLVSGIKRKEMRLFDLPVLIYATLLYVTLIYVVFQSEPRYSIPFRPELYMAAVWSVYSLFRRLWAQKTSRADIAAK